MKNGLLGRGVEKIISKDSLAKRIEKNKLRIKFGVDPSSCDIHIGHSIALRKLKQFQERGDKIIFLIGDYTAAIGDPSGVNKTRPVLSEKEINQNAETYLSQVGKILDIRKVEIRRNSEWFRKFNLKDLIDLSSKFSVASIIERDDFNRRLKGGLEISMHELFYPMMQAYDSIMLEADVEVGGNDQMFNMLAGRELQKKIGQTPQEVIMTPLLVGTDGSKKMSKSLNNYIGITESPDQQFGKIMSIPDSLIINYFELATEVSTAIIKKYQREIKSGKNPRNYKEKLALEIVATYYGEESADQAKKRFIEQFRDKKNPDNMTQIKLLGNYELPLLMIEIGVATSKSDAKRLIEQGGVKIDGTVLKDSKAQVAIKKGVVIQTGKRRFWRIK